jgi:hypothetical protein
LIFSLRAVHALIDAEDDARRRAGKLAELSKDGGGGDGKSGSRKSAKVSF